MGFLLNSNIISILVIILFKSTCIIAPATLIFTVHNALLLPTAQLKPLLAHQPSFSGKTLMSNGNLLFPNSLSSLSSLKLTSNGKPALEPVVKASRSDDYGHGDHNDENENLESKMLELEKHPEKVAELMKNLLANFQAITQKNTDTDESKKPNEPIMDDILTYAAKGILHKEEEGEDRSQFHLPLGRLAFADEEIKRIEKFSNLKEPHKILTEFPQQLKHLGVANYDTILSNIYKKVKRDELRKVVFDLLKIKQGSDVSQSEALKKYNVLRERIQNDAAKKLVEQMKLPKELKNAFLESQKKSSALLKVAFDIYEKGEFWKP